ncbi:MAG: 30S ribosomal protein S9 [Planctomycetota bacterium]
MRRPKKLLYPQNHTRGTGRRKAAVARVRLLKGTGLFQINGRELDDYFGRLTDRQAVLAPLRAVRALGKYDIFVRAHGGGMTGQAGALVLGIARALIRAEPEAEAVLRAEGFLTRDAREVERKKYGQRGARRRFQFSKR